MQSAKVIMTLWVRWKKPVKLAITLDPEDVEGVQDIGGNTGDNYIWVEMPFNSLMTEFFEGSDIKDLIQRVFAYIKTQGEIPRIPESGFTLDQIMYLHINFHRLVLTRGSSYMKLPEWIAKKKAVINPKNEDEECFKWGVIAPLHHEEIKHHPERIILLKHYEDQYNWNGLNFPLAIQKIGKFEWNSLGTAVNVLFNKEESIYTARRSELNGKCSKQVNLLMVVDGEKRHYTAIKNISRLLSKLNGKTQHAYHYCMNCLNGFRTESARNKHYEHYSSNGHVKIKMPTGKKRWLKFHDGQYQFKVPFMLYADFESILKPVDKQYREKMKKMKAEKKGKTLYTEKINTHVPSGWCVHSTFAYGDVPDPLKTYEVRTVLKSL